ncbi:unnamed protein product [Heligmosomoides polygyrus]|uniref:Uncharacterized protein n=1 Tax=Heligmosomoides polygyrus TaxID=6339 RepID=A0A3P7XI56_HELPZ|nr:unnamed protein product [Heligmosomoides polygyrus]
MSLCQPSERPRHESGRPSTRLGRPWRKRSSRWQLPRTEAEPARTSRQEASVDSTSTTTLNTARASLVGSRNVEKMRALAEVQAFPEEEASVLGDLQSHWDANACDQSQYTTSTDSSYIFIVRAAGGLS